MTTKNTDAASFFFLFCKALLLHHETAFDVCIALSIFDKKKKETNESTLSKLFFFFFFCVCVFVCGGGRVTGWEGDRPMPDEHR